LKRKGQEKIRMKKKNSLLIAAIPVLIILAGLTAYQYGYQGVRREMNSIKELEESKTEMLEKYIALIAEKPNLEKKLEHLKEERKNDESKLIEAQTLSIAAASLQETIKALVTGRGG